MELTKNLPLPIVDNSELYAIVISRFAGDRDYSLYSNGLFAVDGKTSDFALGIDKSGNILAGQISAGGISGIRWHQVDSVQEVFGKDRYLWGF